MDIRHPGLWSHYQAYMKAALALIREHQDKVVVSRVKFSMVHLFEPLQRLPEFGNLHSFFASPPLAARVFVDAGGKPIAQAEAQSWWLMNLYVMPILSEYMGRELVLDFDEARAKVVYADLEASLECTEAVYSVVAPLQQFEGPDEEIRVDATVVLRRLTEDEKEHLWHLGEFGGMVDRSQTLGTEFCLGGGLVTERSAPTNLSTVRDPMMRAVTVLRLLKSGQVGVPAVLARLLKPAFGVPGGIIGTSGAPAALGPSYTLALEESEPLVATYQALAEVSASRTLAVALRRFNQAYQRDRPDDRLIDYWIALEALFLPGISDELSFRASLRIAYYLTTSPDERQGIFDKMRLSYDTRSRIVHGEPPKADAGEVASDTEEILRRALRAEVTNLGSLDVERLDAAIARGGSPEQEGTLE